MSSLAPEVAAGAFSRALQIIAFPSVGGASFLEGKVLPVHGAFSRASRRYAFPSVGGASFLEGKALPMHGAFS